MAAYLDKDLELDGIINVINSEIDTRRTYGHREEVIPKGQSGRLLSWSNGSASWWMYGNVRKGPSVVKLDANIILITYKPGGWPKELASTRVLDNFLEFLKPLPLYSGSTEAKQRGNFSLKGIDIPPGIVTGIIEGTLDRDSEEALLRIIKKTEDNDQWAQEMERRLGPTQSVVKPSFKLTNKCSECGKVYGEFEPIKGNLSKLIGKAVCRDCIKDRAIEKQSYWVRDIGPSKGLEPYLNSVISEYKSKGYKLLD